MKKKEIRVLMDKRREAERYVQATAQKIIWFWGKSAENSSKSQLAQQLFNLIHILDNGRAKCEYCSLNCGEQDFIFCLANNIYFLTHPFSFPYRALFFDRKKQKKFWIEAKKIQKFLSSPSF